MTIVTLLDKIRADLIFDTKDCKYAFFEVHGSKKFEFEDNI